MCSPSDRLPITRDLTLAYVFSLIVVVFMTVASVAGLLVRTDVYPTDELLRTFVPNDVVNLVVGVPILLYPIVFLILGALTESFLAELATKTTRVALWGDTPRELRQKFQDAADYAIQIVDVEVGDSEDVCSSPPHTKT